MRQNKRPCGQCGERETRSVAGLCWHCLPAPAVRRDGDTIVIDGIRPMPIDAALKLAHAIADECTP